MQSFDWLQTQSRQPARPLSVFERGSLLRVRDAETVFDGRSDHYARYAQNARLKLPVLASVRNVSAQQFLTLSCSVYPATMTRAAPHDLTLHPLYFSVARYVFSCIGLLENSGMVACRPCPCCSYALPASWISRLIWYGVQTLATIFAECEVVYQRGPVPEVSRGQGLCTETAGLTGADRGSGTAGGDRLRTGEASTPADS